VERPKDYIAPSWSWASVNAGVSWLLYFPITTRIQQKVAIQDAVVNMEMIRLAKSFTDGFVSQDLSLKMWTHSQEA
jgi:hypothetical protein